ncbi:peptide ABC transporter permease [Gluconobacter potus]|uniref:Peptide ABC transporter permease n=1 Tax=Gluconobacter potus TaxID=2724927 RepID=A0A149QW98_9PROT|nr:ABC transporter permease [Gluconobacter potus]KXV01427.1 peptide ABC transporter permease [Gluconobacter potus]
MSSFRHAGIQFIRAILILWGAFTVTFFLLQMMPGDAVMVRFMDPELGLSPDQIEAMRVLYSGSSSPVLQYCHTILRMLHGDFGYSVQLGVPVRTLIAAALPVTLRLAVVGFILSLVWTLLIATGASLLPARPLRQAFQAIPGFWSAIPLYWSGIFIIQILSFKLRLLPVVGVGPWEGIILPALAVSLPIAAPQAKLLLQQIEETERLPFVMAIRTKGASQESVFFRHILPNSVTPCLTMAGLSFGELIAGAIVTETIFGLNGLGRLTRDAVSGQDVAVLQAVVMIGATGFVAANLVVDLLIPLINPSLRSSAAWKEKSGS